MPAGKNDGEAGSVRIRLIERKSKKKTGPCDDRVQKAEGKEALSRAKELRPREAGLRIPQKHVSWPQQAFAESCCASLTFRSRTGIPGN